MVWVPEATRLNLIWRWEFVIPVAGRGRVGISGRAFIALHTLHLVGQFIALRTAQHRFILSPEFWRRMAASVGPEAAPHLMELSRPSRTLTVKENLGGKTSFSETPWWNFNKDQNLFFISSLSQNRIYCRLECRAAAAVWLHQQEESYWELKFSSHFSYSCWWGTIEELETRSRRFVCFL